MLQMPVKALNEGGLSGNSKVGKTLLDLRRTVEDLDPGQAAGAKKFLGMIPFGDRVTDYFRKYQSAQSHLNGILHSLQSGQDELVKDNVALNLEKKNLWESMGRLNQYVYVAERLDARLAAQVATLEATDPEKAKALREDVLFYVRQKHQDLLTQLAVSIQNYLAIDIIIKNNIELIKGVDRATTTTVSALRTAVIVAQALNNQQLVLDQITALNTTTSGIIERTSEALKQNSARIQEQSASSTLSIESLQKAFANIYETMDTIDQFKVRALDNMAATIGTLETEVAKSRSYLDRVSKQDARRAENAAPGCSTSAPAGEGGRRCGGGSPRRTRAAGGAWPAAVGARTPEGTTQWESGRGSGWTGPRHPSPCARGRRPPSSCSGRSTPSSSRPARARCPASCSPGCSGSPGSCARPCPAWPTSVSAAARATASWPPPPTTCPVAIGNYLRLPRDWADTRPIAAGKSSVMLLVDQLDLLGTTMDKVYDAVCRADAEAIIVHGAFLEQKFGQASAGGVLGLGPDPVQVAPPRAAGAAGARSPSPGRRRTSRRPLAPPAGPAGVSLPSDCMSRPTESRLAESLEQLTDVAAEAGLDPAAARDEGLRVAAALAESVPGAAPDWARVAHPGLTELGRINEAFFDAASRGRRWRGAPTDLLEALVVSRHTLAAEYAEALTEVASSAVMLGTAPIWVIANATAASAAYLAAGRASPARPVPACPEALRRSGPRRAWSGIPPIAEGPGTIRAPLRTTRAPSASRVTRRAGGRRGRRRRPSRPAHAPGAHGDEPRRPPADPRSRRAREVGRGAARRARRDDRAGAVKKEIHRQVALLSVERMRTEAGLRPRR